MVKPETDKKGRQLANDAIATTQPSQACRIELQCKDGAAGRAGRENVMSPGEAAALQA